MESGVVGLTRVQGACGPPGWLVVPPPEGFKTSSRNFYFPSGYISSSQGCVEGEVGFVRVVC